MIDIVMQGPIWPRTYTDAQNYLNSPLVDKVVISTWKGEPQLSSSDRIEVIYSEPLENTGMGNRNRQLYSSRVGIEHTTAPIVVKTRSDQRLDNLQMMYDYFMQHNQIEYTFVDGSGPKGAIFVVGLYTYFPFHPQDHLFWGWTEDMQKLFSAPLDPIMPNAHQVTDNSGAHTDYAHTVIRPNTYIGMFYYALFNKDIQHMIEHPHEFIVDAAPRFNEAVALDAVYRDQIFKAFPKIPLWWYKHNRDYPYDWGVPYSEYCS